MFVSKTSMSAAVTLKCPRKAGNGRSAKAIRAAKDNGYTAKITEELLAQDLPPQFFYLALQESNFDPYVSGPNTRKGIAKFIPETAVKYGLRIGLPANPKERNFWRLLSAYRDQIPQETFDYVFYIASAAVIGENPRLFGFDFDNPLAQPEGAATRN